MYYCPLFNYLCQSCHMSKHRLILYSSVLSSPLLSYSLLCCTILYSCVLYSHRVSYPFLTCHVLFSSVLLSTLWSCALLFCPLLCCPIPCSYILSSTLVPSHILTCLHFIPLIVCFSSPVLYFPGCLLSCPVPFSSLPFKRSHACVYRLPSSNL